MGLAPTKENLTFSHFQAKGKQDFSMKDSASIESVVPVLAGLTCSNHTPVRPSKKHSTKCVPKENKKYKQQKT
jgi:hypothetical protein